MDSHILEKEKKENPLDKGSGDKKNNHLVPLCDNCGKKVYEEYVHVTDIVKQLPPIFDRFYDNPSNCTCKNCGHVIIRPPKVA